MNQDTMTIDVAPIDARISALQSLLRRQIDARTVPSGILVDSSARADTLAAFDGSARAPVADQMQWLAVNALMQSSAIAHVDRAADDVPAEADALRASGVVPIFIADYVFERALPGWQQALDRAVAPSPEAIAPALSDVVARSQAIVSSAILATDHDLFTPVASHHVGLTATFVVPTSGYKTNTGRTLTSLALDFGDGATRIAHPDEAVTHKFAAPGVKQITLAVTTSDGATRITRFVVTVAAPAPVPDDIWPIEVDSMQATAWVYRSVNAMRGAAALVEPVLLAEGFPGGRSLEQLWPLVNQSEFVRGLLAAGHDFIILGFKDGTRAIEENARLYRACLTRVIGQIGPDVKVAAGGASMGGLIARYALCAMEHEGVEHRVGTFFTVDTPHLGANIPFSVQAFVQFFSTSVCGKSAREPARLMASPAAQQMLLQWVPPYEEWHRGSFPIASPRRDKFLEDLQRLGWMPQKVDRRIGVADGLPNGVGNGVPDGARAFGFERSAFYWANLYTSTQDRSRVADMVCSYEQAQVWVRGQRIDSAPGGTRSSWKEIYDAIQGMCAYPDHCFVPTMSACAVEVGLHDAVTDQPSSLHAFRASSTTNREHVALPYELKTFLVEQISGKVVDNMRGCAVYAPQRKQSEMFYPGGDDLLRYAYVQGGPSLDTVSFASGGAVADALSAVFSVEREHAEVFFAGQDGLLHFFYVEGGGWRHDCDSFKFTGSVGGGVSAVYSPKARHSEVFFVGDGLLRYFSVVDGGWREERQCFYAAGTVAGGVSAVYSVKREHAEVFFAGNNGLLHYFYFADGSWKHDSVSFQDAGRPIGAVSAAYSGAGEHAEVYFVAQDGYLHRYHVVDGGWRHEDSSFRSGGKVTGGVAAVFSPARNHTEVFYRGEDGYLRFFFHDAEGWHHEGFAGSEKVYGAISAVYNPERAHSEVYFPGADGRLHFYYRADGRWQHSTWPPEPPAHPGLRRVVSPGDR